MYHVYNLPDYPTPVLKEWAERVLVPGTEFSFIVEHEEYVQEMMDVKQQKLADLGIYVTWEEHEERVYLDALPGVSGTYPTSRGFWLYGLVIARREELTHGEPERFVSYSTRPNTV
jgi:hypothetical protein